MVGVGYNAIRADENLIPNWSHGGPQLGGGPIRALKQIRKLAQPSPFSGKLEIYLNKG